MGDVKRPTRLDEVEIGKRRTQVAALYLARVPMQAIADKLGCSKGTVVSDIKAMRQEWREESLGDVGELILREVAEYDTLEGQAAVMYAREHTPEWFDRRLKVKAARRQLLGLDQPVKTDITSGGQSLAGEWEAVRTILLEALAPFAEARAAAAVALSTVDKAP